jgi:hypothetical protein
MELNDGWAYSYITEIELLSKKDITENEETIIKGLLDNCYKIIIHKSLQILL